MKDSNTTALYGLHAYTCLLVRDIMAQDFVPKPVHEIKADDVVKTSFGSSRVIAVGRMEPRMEESYDVNGDIVGPRVQVRVAGVETLTWGWQGIIGSKIIVSTAYWIMLPHRDMMWTTKGNLVSSFVPRPGFLAQMDMQNQLAVLEALME